MVQMSLFEGGAAGRTPGEFDGMMRPGPVRSARDGQITSIEAAERHEGTGKAARHRVWLLEEVRREPGRTAAELGAVTGLGQIEAARRLPEMIEPGLVRKGAARRCSEKGTSMVTWWPVHHGDTECTEKAEGSRA